MLNWKMITAVFLVGILGCAVSQDVQGVAVQEKTAVSHERPHIVVVMCDDLGYGDLSSYGHEVIKTPVLDQLAKNGIRFTDGYSAAPVCSPSRAGMLTGRNPHRAGIYDWIPGGPVHLRDSEVTFPELLRDAGYDTMLSGKWHLNGRFNSPKIQPTPSQHGFNYWFATHNNASPNHRNPSNFVRNGEKVGKIEGYSSSIVVNETLNWLDGKWDREKPFMSVLTFHEPHTPVASRPELVEHYKKYEKINGQAIYWANVAQVDQAVGELVAGLKARGLYENTLIVFTSDNGPEEWMRYPDCWVQHGSVGPLRGHKLDVFEGGIRVPMIVSWPAVIKKGRVSHEAVSSLDLLPTFCNLAQAQPPESLKLDGCDVSDHIVKADKIVREKPLFWFYVSARGYANFAMRDGEYTLVARRTGEMFYPGLPVSAARRYAVMSACRTRSHELYRTVDDTMQTNKLNGKEREIFEQMKKKMDEYWEDLKADAVDWSKQAK